MTTKYEIIEIDQTEITVDVSLLTKTEELFFNATQMAKNFGKRPDDFWKQDQNKEYLEALITLSEGNKNRDDFVQTKRGKFGGTYFHNDLALQFARWLNPIFGVKLDKWIIAKLKEEQARKRERLEAKTGFTPMTTAILNAHHNAEFYHFATENDLINRIVLGMSAKKFKKYHDVYDVRDACTAAQLQDINKLHTANTTLINLGMDYATRKDVLTRYHNGETNLFANAA